MNRIEVSLGFEGEVVVEVSITRGDFMAPVDGCYCTTLYPLVV
jgi:hypothetical protein